MSLYSVGDTEHGNRLFDFKVDGAVYKPSKDEHAFIRFDFESELQKLEYFRFLMLVDEGMVPATVTVSDNHFNITTDTVMLYSD